MARFLCCLPLRFGVFVISFLQFLVCGGLAGFFWWALWYGAGNSCEHFPYTSRVLHLIPLQPLL